jgi:hypothetical protein
MRIMMTLQHDADSASIDDYLAAQGIRVIERERLDPEQTAILSVVGTGTPILERTRSGLSALWIFDAPSRAAAIELAKNAPGGEGTLEIRESFTPQDFGAPADAPSPPPPPPLQPGKQRYIAFVINDAIADAIERPPEAAMTQMDAYCAPLAADGTMIGGEGLKSTARGSRIRRSAAQRFVLDGPFTESKELVGGFMIVQSRTLDEAVDIIRPWLLIHHEALKLAESAIEVRRLL